MSSRSCATSARGSPSATASTCRTQQIQDLAARRLEAILDPRTIKPSLLEQMRRSAGDASSTPGRPLPNEPVRVRGHDALRVASRVAAVHPAAAESAAEAVLQPDSARSRALSTQARLNQRRRRSARRSATAVRPNGTRCTTRSSSGSSPSVAGQHRDAGAVDCASNRSGQSGLQRAARRAASKARTHQARPAPRLANRTRRRLAHAAQQPRKRPTDVAGARDRQTDGAGDGRASTPTPAARPAAADVPSPEGAATRATVAVSGGRRR